MTTLNRATVQQPTQVTGFRNYEDERPECIDGADGSSFVNPGGRPGTLETRTVTINAATEVPADNSSVTTAELITLDTFTAGKKRVRVTYHHEASAIPFAMAVVVTVNAGSDAVAATNLSIADVTENGTGSADTKQRIISAASPVVEYNFQGTSSTAVRVDLVGIPPNGTGAGDVYVSVEVW